MANMKHALGQVEGASALFVAGKCVPTSSTVATLSQLSPPLAMQDDMTATLASSVFTIVITNFKGPLGSVVPMVSALHATAGVFATIVSTSYSGDTLTLIVNTFSAEATPADETFFFTIWAF